MSRCQVHYETCTHDVSRALSLINQACPPVSILTGSKWVCKSQGDVWRWVSRSNILVSASAAPLHPRSSHQVVSCPPLVIIPPSAALIHVLVTRSMLLARAMPVSDTCQQIVSVRIACYRFSNGGSSTRTCFITRTVGIVWSIMPRTD